MEDKKNMTDEELKNLTEEQLRALINDTLNKFAYVFSSASKHISQLEEYRKKASLSGTRIDEVDQMLDYAKPKLKKALGDIQDIVGDVYGMDAKILTQDNKSLEMEKSYVETISSQARLQQENIQRRRDERYEEMISEAEEKLGPIESPMDRLRR